MFDDFMKNDFVRQEYERRVVTDPDKYVALPITRSTYGEARIAHWVVAMPGVVAGYGKSTRNYYWPTGNPLCFQDEASAEGLARLLNLLPRLGKKRKGPTFTEVVEAHNRMAQTERGDG